MSEPEHWRISAYTSPTLAELLADRNGTSVRYGDRHVIPGPEVGDPVKVFGSLPDGSVHPDGGWDGEIVKVWAVAGLPTVTIRFDGKRRERFSVPGQNYCGNAALGLRWRTPRQVEEKRRRDIAWALIVDCGFDLIRPGAMTTEYLETVAEALRNIPREAS